MMEKALARSSRLARSSLTSRGLVASTRLRAGIRTSTAQHQFGEPATQSQGENVSGIPGSHASRRDYASEQRILQQALQNSLANYDFMSETMAKISPVEPSSATSSHVELLRSADVPELFQHLVRNSGVTVGVYDEQSGSQKHYRLDAVSLRDRCRCEACVNVHSGQRVFHTSQIPQNIEVNSASQDGQGNLSLTWKNDIASSSASHTTTIDQSQIQEMISRQVAPKMQPAHDQKPWEFQEMQSRYNQGLNKATFQAFLEDEITFERILFELKNYGLAFFTNVPKAEVSVEQLGERIGPLRHTFYGRTWDVKDKPKATNVAYTATFLGMHMDLLYMKIPPGLQLLHCIESSADGGESLFVDALDAAYKVRDVSPAAFDALVNFPVSYHYNAPQTGKYFFDTKPTIEIDHKVMNALGAHNQPERPVISNINWSPPFQAPFTADSGTHDSGAALRRYLSAASAFSSIVDDPAKQFRVLLKPGECVIFNNRRVLHGREKFKSGNTLRWLKGAYVDTDDFESCLRHATLSK